MGEYDKPGGYEYRKMPEYPGALAQCLKNQFLRLSEGVIVV